MSRYIPDFAFFSFFFFFFLAWPTLSSLVIFSEKITNFMEEFDKLKKAGVWKINLGHLNWVQSFEALLHLFD